MLSGSKPAEHPRSVAPEVLEPICGPLGVVHGMLDRPMAQPILDRSRVVPCSNARKGKSAIAKIDPHLIFGPRPPSAQAGGPANLKCICVGNTVPFYCPKHGSVENP